MGADVEHTWGTAPEFVGPRHELRETLLLDLFLKADPGRQVLNVGAGQGSFTRLLEGRGFEVVSSDVSRAAVDVLRDSVRGEALHADMTDLPFADRRFDAVVAGEVIEHIEDDRKALSEAARVLRPGGVVALSVPAHPEWFGASDRWAGHARRYTRARLQQAVGDAGLTLECLRPWGFPVSATYHRAVYDRRAAALATDGRERRNALRILRIALQVDRLFVGVERGCLGYLALARTSAGP
ncbi:MAG: class I SAM-dependent methyltransferase [Thermoleophilia bacterium]|nr:class I SAM-dependent methyltransferase [Thermoleophilia bacterium]MDH4341076.1 class I SAM-dependent methyltransferase [Thermoleophilia bacterium]